MKVRVDYVLFDDGSNWGPDKAKMSLYLSGVRDAARQMGARQREE
ncbi:MAG TPA: hypothetical protein VLH09_06090 [Bryobacteraceae bacterium]|nr:hypothetical protein [Bryobacteraceae bacterium]